jgi:hypothetical protein
VEFGVVEAVNCAVDVHREMAAQHCRPGGTADRIPPGINLSDIIKGRGDIYATA